MILSTLLSFFGGSAFPAVWGEASSYLSARQTHRQEIELMKLQAQLDGERQARELEAIKLQHELGVQVVRVQGEAAVAKAEAEAWEKVAANATAPSGIWLVDLWNGLVRPALATICTLLVVLHYYRADWVLDEQGWSLVGAVLGIYVADRTLFRRGK